MPSVTLSRLTYSGPSGQTLFSNLDLSFGTGRTGLVGRNGVGKTTLLRLITGELAPTAGTISVSGRIGVLRQQVQPGPAETIADLFDLRAGLALLERATAGRATADEIAEADWTLESRLDAALDALALDVGPETLLMSLSGGQRTRAALAALVFGAPDLILLDEPTNNLDAEGREAVTQLLAGWRGAAIVISHDRDLLDTMDAIVELTGLGATSYGGNWSQYRERKALELAAVQHDFNIAERQVRDAERAAQEARERQARRDAGGRRKAAKGGAPKILLGGLKRRAEETAGGLNRLAEKQADTAQVQAAEARAKIEVLTPFALKLAPSGLPTGKVVLRASDLTGGYDPEHPLIDKFSFDLIGPERVAISGPNGVGKTTLLKLLTGVLEPLAGDVQIGGPMALLDQQVGLLDRDQSIVDNFRRLNPQSSINDCRSVLAAFKFRNDAALQTVGTLSGGEMLRAGLACVLGGKTPPMLVVLDEPTNHLDIEAVEVVEAGLRAYDGALLVISHDRTFLDNIGVTRDVRLG
ncbi:ATP-binding cassette domain-containing protein [Devosia sp. XJ19-1]|uniref:ATP-binding cassette domain-containing protein n=1 Tax=Devosia ureilytica TaxID=2952754 RepID=A0A9Q4APE7_9HYPH|nr:ABC-F family ATP-binding cassette domain-containing protein [Devosia ureilytica]MCP8883713.1 ATP-binding cassette domain-containing protein [Devosia ureilytica]MCP8887321.1 ATP-binding cassette domain-containing protein [Devosia ureilytica]